MKEIIAKTIDSAADDIIKLSKNIHSNPELAFEEHKATGFLKEFLEKYDFNVEMGIAGLPTAFRAEYKGNSGGPVVAFLAEYDALPEIGHACGHNLIAAMGVGAAVGLASVIKETGGRVIVLGTPGEEGLGGKITMVRNGAFDNIDYALMIHPSGSNLINRGSTALCHWYIKFIGKNAHSSNPEQGVNALSAVMQTFNNIDHLRPLMPMRANINGIITKGGTAANVITDEASCELTVRAGTLAELKLVNKYIVRAIKSAEVLYDAKAEYHHDPAYAEMYPNHNMNWSLRDNMKTLGIEMAESDGKGKYGSSDIGNVSLVVPSVHAYLNISPKDVGHTVGFAEASSSEAGHKMAINGSKGLAMTGYDILSKPELRTAIKHEFETTVPKYDTVDFE